MCLRYPSSCYSDCIRYNLYIKVFPDLFGEFLLVASVSVSAVLSLSFVKNMSGSFGLY